jgi:hypothetical protein
MATTLEDLNDKPGVNESIVRTLKRVLIDLLKENGVKVKEEEVKITGLEVTLADNGHGDKPKSPSTGWCIFYNLDGLPYWGPCPK